MWYYCCVVRTRDLPTAIPAFTRPLGSAKKSHNSNHCYTSAISTRNPFVCHTYKTKDFNSFPCHTFSKFIPLPPVIVNQVSA
jgi:hypothetical protein